MTSNLSIFLSMNHFLLLSLRTLHLNLLTLLILCFHYVLTRQLWQSLLCYLLLQLKMSKRHNSHCEEDIQMVNKHIKRCSASLAIRKMQIKIILKYDHTLIRIAKIKKIVTTLNAGKDVKKLITHTCVLQHIGTSMPWNSPQE